MSAPVRGAAGEARKGGLGLSRVPGSGRGSEERPLGEEGLGRGAPNWPKLQWDVGV